MTCDVDGCEHVMKRHELPMHHAESFRAHFDLMVRPLQSTTKEALDRSHASEVKAARALNAAGNSVRVHVLSQIRDLVERPMEGFEVSVMDDDYQ